MSYQLLWNKIVPIAWIIASGSGPESQTRSTQLSHKFSTNADMSSIKSLLSNIFNSHEVRQLLLIKVLDLGVMTDSDLSYACHISIVSKARSRSGINFRNFRSHDINLLRQAFISFVRPILEYASQVWNPSILKYTTDLESVQRNFTYRIRSY